MRENQQLFVDECRSRCRLIAARCRCIYKLYTLFCAHRVCLFDAKILPTKAVQTLIR